MPSPRPWRCTAARPAVARPRTAASPAPAAPAPPQVPAAVPPRAGNRHASPSPATPCRAPPRPFSAAPDGADAMPPDHPIRTGAQELSKIWAIHPCGITRLRSLGRGTARPSPSRAWRLQPVDLPGPVEGDALGGPPRPEGGQAAAERLPVVGGARRPADLRDRGQAREGHPLRVGERTQRFCPERRLDPEQGFLADAWQPVRRIPAV